MCPQEIDPENFPWQEIDDLNEFNSSSWTERILNRLNVYKSGTMEPDETKLNKVKKLLETYSQPCIKRLNTLEWRLKEQFIGKDEIIEMVIVSAIAHQPMLLVGPPGTAKSKIILKFCEGLGIERLGTHQTVFQYLLHGFTEPDEVLGPVNIKKLGSDEPKFLRIRDGSITDAEVIFLDEVFRANSAILNALLTIINERQVYEGGQMQAAKARLIYGASNSTPSPRQLDELAAFYERFIIRMESMLIPMEFVNAGAEVKTVSKDRENLLRKGWEGEVRELRASYRPAGSAMEPVACLNDILLLNRAVAERWSGSDFDTLTIRPHYHELVITLAGGEEPICKIDDRKFIRLFLVVFAHALYKHNGPPIFDDLCVLKHIWNDVISKTRVAEEVQKFINTKKQSSSTGP